MFFFSSIYLNDNSLSCDCDLQWLIANYSSAIATGSCASPSALANMPLFGSNAITSDQICAADTTTTTTTTAATTTTTISDNVIIHTAPSEVEIQVGNSVALPCVATGNPTPTVTWTSPRGAVILSSGNYNFDSATGKKFIFTSKIVGD